MHIAEGMLSPGVLATGAALAVAGVSVGLRRMGPEETPRVAVLASAFFVASLVHVPFGPASIHLVLNGLLGLVLGWAAFPAIAVALLLQAVFFGFGGLAVLGVNTCVMAAPAVLAHYLLRHALASATPARAPVIGAAVAVLSILGAAGLAALALVLSDQGFAAVAAAFALTALPLAAVEAVVCAAAVAFLLRVRPEVFTAARLAPDAAA
jgi:cobalt/nickel transport system permease protein